MKTAIELIAEERQRQIDVEGWSAEHDDRANFNDKLARAAACYAMPSAWRASRVADRLWPWFDRWWKPTPDNRERELVKAGALIVAEIERLRRMRKQANDQDSGS